MKRDLAVDDRHNLSVVVRFLATMMGVADRDDASTVQWLLVAVRVNMSMTGPVLVRVARWGINVSDTNSGGCLLAASHEKPRCQQQQSGTNVDALHDNPHFLICL
ncbi:MAG: hypothetical protein MK364_14310 [Pirellulales bacterium]|nr:hypothetical protein [Pirellulales bacterium]